MEKLDVYEKLSFGEILSLTIYVILTVIAFALAHMPFFNTDQMFFLFACSFVLACIAAYKFRKGYFRKEIAFRADEHGVLSVFLFYVSWNCIDSFYMKEEDDRLLIEMKVIDNNKFLSTLDIDIANAYSDELEENLALGHELFFFDTDHFTVPAEDVLHKLNEMLKFYRENPIEP